jgi:hypothetical protein
MKNFKLNCFIMLCAVVLLVITGCTVDHGPLDEDRAQIILVAPAISGSWRGTPLDLNYNVGNNTMAFIFPSGIQANTFALNEEVQWGRLLRFEPFRVHEGKLTISPGFLGWNERMYITQILSAGQNFNMAPIDVQVGRRSIIDGHWFGASLLGFNPVVTLQRGRRYTVRHNFNARDNDAVKIYIRDITDTVR